MKTLFPNLSGLPKLLQSNKGQDERHICLFSLISGDSIASWELTDILKDSELHSINKELLVTRDVKNENRLLYKALNVLLIIFRSRILHTRNWGIAKGQCAWEQS